MAKQNKTRRGYDTTDAVTSGQVAAKHGLEVHEVDKSSDPVTIWLRGTIAQHDAFSREEGYGPEDWIRAKGQLPNTTNASRLPSKSVADGLKPGDTLTTQELVERKAQVKEATQELRSAIE